MVKIKKTFRKGEIWIVDLRFSGMEISKIRPALVVSSDVVNSYSSRIIVLPASSRTSMALSPDRIFVPKEKSKLKKDSIFMATQIRAVEKSRLVKKVGILGKIEMKEVENSLKLVLGMLDMD